MHHAMASLTVTFATVGCAEYMCAGCMCVCGTPWAGCNPVGCQACCRVCARMGVHSWIPLWPNVLINLDVPLMCVGF